MNGANRSLNALTRDTSGNVLALTAMGMILAAALIGGGIDMGRGYRAKSRLQDACDAGVLAGRRAVESTGYTAAAQQQALNYFNNNFDSVRMEGSDTTFTTSAQEKGNIINGTATTTVKTAIMKMFGFKKFDLSVNCTASMGVGNSDVILVLDTTGSMAGSGISALQTAVKNFYDTIKKSTDGSTARVRYGFVPYSQSVNVGALLKPEWIVDNYDVSTRVAQWQWADADTANGSTNYSSRSNCESGGYARTTAWAEQTPTRDTRTVYLCKQVGSNWRRFTRAEYQGEMPSGGVPSPTFLSWIYQSATYDVSKFKLGEAVTTNTGNSGASVTSTWGGCIEERQTQAMSTVTFSTIDGMSPYTWDLDIDKMPSASNPDSQWRPMWPQVAYYRTSGKASRMAGSPIFPNYYACPRAAQLLRTMNEGEFDAYADSLVADGNTYLDIGLLWGGRLLSPDGIFKDNVNEQPNNGGEVSRHLIFMTDGVMDPQPSVLAAYGIEQNDFRITSDGSDTQATARHNSRFRAICSAIKAKGIRVWTISFRVALSTDMKNCASANSSFNASSTAALDAAFQEIAKQVGELRITD